MFNSEKAAIFRRRLYQLKRLEHAQGGRTLQGAMKTGVNLCCMTAAGVKARLLAIQKKTARVKVGRLLKRTISQMGKQSSWPVLWR